MWCILVLSLVGLALGQSDNVNGVYAVMPNHHYANKSSMIWGYNNMTSWSVSITMSSSCATYNCTSSCPEDPVWYYDWNKLWGKVRCGYAHDIHQDSDRFVWRRCSDPTCKAYQGVDAIQIAAYSYDGGEVPYQNEYLLKEFATLLSPNVQYRLGMDLHSDGLTVFSLYNVDTTLLETQTIQHLVTCPETYNEGTVSALYFGGTCRAPVEVDVTYA